MFLACFSKFHFLTQTEFFAWAIAFALWPFLAIFKMVSFFEYKLFFAAVFCTEQLWCNCGHVFGMFQAICFLTQTKLFCMGYSLCIVAIFGNVQNGLIFRILAFFPALFCTVQLWCNCGHVFGMFQKIWFFDPDWVFYMGYSLCIVAIFVNFQSCLLSRILAFFKAVFFHRTTFMCL